MLSKMNAELKKQFAAVFAVGSVFPFFIGGRTEHPAQRPRRTECAGGHSAVPRLSHSGVSPHAVVDEQALADRRAGMDLNAGLVVH